MWRASNFLGGGLDNSDCGNYVSSLYSLKSKPKAMDNITNIWAQASCVGILTLPGNACLKFLVRGHRSILYGHSSFRLISKCETFP